MIHWEKRKTASLKACRWEKGDFLTGTNATISFDPNGDVYGSSTSLDQK